MNVGVVGVDVDVVVGDASFSNGKVVGGESFFFSPDFKSLIVSFSIPSSIVICSSRSSLSLSDNLGDLFSSSVALCSSDNGEMKRELASK